MAESPEHIGEVIHQVRGEDIQAKVMILLSWSQNWIFVVNELFSIEEQKHLLHMGDANFEPFFQAVQNLGQKSSSH